MSAVFDEIKRLINRSGISPTRIANTVNIHPVTIQAWIDGKVQEARLDNLIKVAEFFGKRIELTGGEPRVVPDTPTTVAIKARQAREFVGLWRRYQ